MTEEQIKEMMEGMSTKPPLGAVNDTYSNGDGPPMMRMMII